MLDLVYGALRPWLRIITHGSQGARTLERDGVLAAIVPVARERSVLNSVVYDSADALSRAYEDLAAAYEAVGANWTVWVRPSDTRAAQQLRERGHVLDAQPEAMARRLDAPPARPELELDWTSEGSMADVGVINDLAYGFDGSLKQDVSDFLMIADTSVNSTKLNLILETNARVDVALTPEGDAHSTVTYVVRNPFPEWSEGRDPELVQQLMLSGTYGAYVRVYVPEGARLQDVRLDGRTAGVEEIGVEFGRTVFGRYFPVRPGEQGHVQFVYETEDVVSVADGLAQVAASAPAFAVVDMRLNDGNGIEVISALKEKRPDARAVVLTTGTFLGGRIHIGLEHHPGGRAGDAPANALAQRLRALPFRVDRLKTGTPPRIDGRSVDFSVMETQPGDERRPVMSMLGSVEQHPRQICCFITHTNARTHEIIRGALDRSPMFSGAIEGIGPRYCPSIEDKVHRFAERDRHQVFVEPEGLETPELYPNGISTSLPFDVQLELVRSIRGFERAHLTRPGYAIEYDYFDPRDLEYSLQTKAVGGLFFAGQINGTTGYEEAAAQGLLAGVNAALAVAGKPAWFPARNEAYIGVLVDDLISLGTNEPYRMFTSRAEFRLLLREDNADRRLTARGRELGLVGDERWKAFQEKEARIAEVRERLARTRVMPDSALAIEIEQRTGERISRDVTLLELLKRPAVGIADLAPIIDLDAGSAALRQLEIETTYEGYIRRQEEDIARLKRHEAIALPAELDYLSLDGLSHELRQKLHQARPATLARAARIPGITPAALSLLLVRVKQYRESA
jgi:tRNA uridine 5-carboxymethylaminomethyl modification enzyme